MEVGANPGRWTWRLLAAAVGWGGGLFRKVFIRLSSIGVRIDLDVYVSILVADIISVAAPVGPRVRCLDGTGWDWALSSEGTASHSCGASAFSFLHGLLVDT